MDLQLTITLTAAGQVSVSGPLENSLICYGMLEAAKDAIRDHVAQAAKSKIIPILKPLPSMNGAN